MNLNHEVLLIHDQSRQKKDARQRLAYFADWITENNLNWYAPNLDAYRDFLLQQRKLSPSSVAAHISTIRARYETLLEETETLRRLEQAAQSYDDPQEFIKQALHSLKQATSKDAGRVEYKRQIDIVHLTPLQIDELLAAPNMNTHQGVRDTMAMGLMFCTGISEVELCTLQISDFQHNNENDLTIHVPLVPGGIERTIPIYDHILFSHRWLETYIATWIKENQITEGHLLRGFFRGGMRTNAKPVTGRGIQKMLTSYPIPDSTSSNMTVTALILRRTYARWLFLSGIDFEVIQRNLGHNSTATTLEYIGTPERTSWMRERPYCSASPLLTRLAENWEPAYQLAL